MKIERLRTDAELASLRTEWKNLNPSNPFLSFDWLNEWWLAFKGMNALYVLVGRDDGNRIQFIAPWYLHSSASRGKELRFLGSGRVCSDYMTIISATEFDSAMTTLLADWLLSANDWDCMRFEGIAKDDANMSKLAEALTLGGATDCESAQPNFWRLNLPSTYEDYVVNCQKKIRQKLRKVERDSVDTEFSLCQSSDDLAQRLNELIELHGRRRSTLGDEGCFCSNEFVDFIHGVARRLLEDNKLWLGRMSLKGQSIATCFAIEEDRVLYYYQTGTNPDFEKLQPGWLMNIHLIRAAIERRLQAVDFLRGDEPYKARLSAQPIPSTRLAIVSPRTSSQLRNNLWQAGVKLKNLTFQLESS